MNILVSPGQVGSLVLPAKLSRKLHKWLALLIGVQMFLWALSGAFMVVVHIDIIQGNMLVTNAQHQIRVHPDTRIPLDHVVANFPDAHRFTLTSVMERAVYLVEGDSTRLLDAKNGIQISPIGEDLAAEIASYHYRGDAKIRNVELLKVNPPIELQMRPHEQAHQLPLWRVDFDDMWNSTFYIDSTTGEFTARRHSLWRIYDFFWMLHIMDYDSRANVNNLVLLVFAALSLVASLSGLWLLKSSFRG